MPAKCTLWFFNTRLVVDAVLAASRKLLTKTASAKPAFNRASFDAIDACVEEQMHRLKLPGVSLAIADGLRYRDRNVWRGL